MSLMQRIKDATKIAVTQARKDLKLWAVESRERDLKDRAVYNEAFKAEKMKLLKANTNKSRLSIEERARRNAHKQFGKKRRLKIGL